MCTGGIPIVIKIWLCYEKDSLDEKFEYFLLSYNENKINNTRIHHIWEPIYC
jgi:hypothetical protein